MIINTISIYLNKSNELFPSGAGHDWQLICKYY